MNRRTLLYGFSGLLIPFAGCVEPFSGSTLRESFESTHPIDQTDVVEIQNRNGEVQVFEGTTDDLRLSGEKQARTSTGLDEIEIEVSPGPIVTVEVSLGDRDGLDRRGVDLEVAVPSGIVVEQVSTENGDLSVQEVSGDVEAVTMNGSIAVEAVDGYVTASTTNGSVKLTDTTGIDGVESTNGDLEVDINAIRDDTTCRTSNGDITARAGPDLEVGLDLLTSLGSVTIEDLEYDAAVESGSRITNGSLHGGSTPILYLRTTNGSIILKPT